MTILLIILAGFLLWKAGSFIAKLLLGLLIVFLVLLALNIHLHLGYSVHEHHHSAAPQH